MTSNITLKSLAVNSGKVWDSESPLWAGTSQVTDAVNGRLCTMAVSLDRDWLWVRFSSKPSEKYAKELIALGFIWSSKRMAWHVEPNELVCATLNNWGAITVSYHKLVSSMPVKPVTKIVGDLNVEDGHVKPVDKAVRDALAAKAKADKAAEVAAAKLKAAEEKAAAKADSKPTMSSRERELDLRERELALRERELAIRERELALMSAQPVVQVAQPEATKPEMHYVNGGYHIGGLKLG